MYPPRAILRPYNSLGALILTWPLFSHKVNQKDCKSQGLLIVDLNGLSFLVVPFSPRL